MLAKRCSYACCLKNFWRTFEYRQLGDYCFITAFLDTDFEIVFI